MIAERDFNLDSFSGIEAAINDANQNWRRGNYAAALDKYTSILAKRLSLANEYNQSVSTFFGPADKIVLEQLSDLARLFGYPDAARDLLEVLTTLSEGANESHTADYFRLKRIDLLLGFGKPLLAHDALTEMEPRIGNILKINFSRSGLNAWETNCNWPATTKTERKLLFCLLYLAMGRILSSYGCYANAIAAVERGAEYGASLQTSISTHLNAQFKLCLAAALLEKGELEAASKALNKIGPTVTKIKEPWPAIRWLELTAKFHQLTGQFNQARDELVQVVHICNRFKFTRATAAASLNLANILIVMNQTSVARDLLDLVRKLAVEIDDSALKEHTKFLASSLLLRTESNPLAGPPTVAEMRRAIAEPIQPEAQAVDVKLPEAPASANFLGWFEDRTANFYYQLMTGDLNCTSVKLAEMKKRFGKTDSELIQVRLQVLEGTLAYYQDRIKDSESMLSSACPKLEDLGLRSELWQTLPLMGWCWRRLSYPDDLVQTLNDNSQNILESITSELASQDQARFLLNKGTADELYIDSQIDRLLLMRAELERTPFYLRPVRKWKLMSHVNDLLVHIESYKSKLANPMSGGQKSDDRTKPYSLWRRLVSHERRHASIYFLVLPTRIIWIRNSWLRLDFDVVRVKRVTLRDLVQKWHLLVARIKDWRRAPTSSEDKQDSPLNHLLRNLIPLIDEQTSEELTRECSSTVKEIVEALQIPAILNGLPKYVRSLVIHPDDVLHGFPFAAIQSDGRYLVERFAVSEGLDYSDRETTARSGKRKALLVGVSNGTSHIPDLPGKAVGRLPGAKSEVGKIEQWLAENNFQVRVLSEKEASKSTLIEALPAASLVHIACHGVFTPNRPDKTGLVLVPESGVGEILTIKELYELNLASIEHATLSSCSSADNFVLPGRFVFSFPEGLHRAGVRSVLANLWEVDDRVAVAFMKRFYEYLNDHARDEALRRTQLDCIGVQSMDHTSRPLDDIQGITVREPFYWAGYILCGDYRRLLVSS